METSTEKPGGEAFDRYVPPVAPESPVVEPPHWTLWLIYLLFRPQQFFKVFVIQAAPVLTVITAWLFGIAGAMDRIEGRMLAGADHPLMIVTQSWSVYWGVAALIGAVSGALYYAIGGWWYRVRLRWSGAGTPEAALSRRVYVYSAQAYVVPFLIYTAWETLAYPTPLAAAAGDDWGGALVMVALLWSVYVSYRGVRTAFDVRDWPARIWFLALPGLVYGVVVAGVLAAAFLSSWVFEPPPEVGRPARIERAAFVLEYPGNWEIDKTDEEYDPDADFGIGPAFADATIRFWFYDRLSDSRECVDATRGNLSRTYDLGRFREIERWGRFPGAGYEVDGTIEGKPFELVLFCRTDESPPFEILQVVEQRAVKRTGPGFDLIRDSLQVRAPE